MGKLFCMVLLDRLSNFTLEKEILHPSQIGFLSENRTADHVFTIRTIIDKYVTGQKEKNIFVFCGF